MLRSPPAPKAQRCSKRVKDVQAKPDPHTGSERAAGEPAPAPKLASTSKNPTGLACLRPSQAIPKTNQLMRYVTI